MAGGTVPTQRLETSLGRQSNGNTKIKSPGEEKSKTLTPPADVSLTTPILSYMVNDFSILSAN
jgi:hypothetical protein